ncbi:MAG: large repetitive protein [Thermoleophilaceae bacterium]|nr:large repetitive protein [Thermoleophilaceae bacterium]
MRRLLVALALAIATWAIAPSAAVAGTVDCPPGQTYTLHVGDPSVALSPQCTGTSALTYSLVTGVSHGSLVGTPDGYATYTPSVGFSGTDQFTYRATDTAGGFAERTVTIVVEAPPPSGLPPSCPSPTNVFVPAGGSVVLTGNCSDPDGDTLTYGLLNFPAGLEIINGTQVRYTPPGLGSATLNYSASDGHGNTVNASVVLTVVPAGTTDVSTGTTPTASDPFVAGVKTDAPGPVTIGERTTSVAPPTGYFLLGKEFNIVAADQTVASPLRLTFTVDSSQLPQSGTVVAFRDGTPIDQACDGSGQAVPDPCVASSSTDASGDLQIVVLSSHASRWNLGYAADRDGDGVPDLRDACPTVAGAAQNGCPLPTNKDQCKNNGWKNYGTTFKNQGDCVSSVAGGGKSK